MSQTLVSIVRLVRDGAEVILNVTEELDGISAALSLHISSASVRKGLMS